MLSVNWLIEVAYIQQETGMVFTGHFVPAVF